MWNSERMNNNAYIKLDPAVSEPYMSTDIKAAVSHIVQMHGHNACIIMIILGILQSWSHVSWVLF